MAEWDDNRKAKWESTLLRWQKLFEQAVHSDRILAEIGLFNLKVLMIINAGALAGVMPVALHESDEMIKVILAQAGQWFALGLLAAVLATGVSYFYQMAITAKAWRILDGVSDVQKPLPYSWAHPMAVVTLVVTVTLLLAAYGLFAYGLYWLVVVLRSS